MRKLIFMAILLSMAGPVEARVWRVEKNGSGDFTVIQQAVDASASGDTIQIGPGRYDDKFLWGTSPWQQYTRVLVTRADLTLIGAGADQTIIGDAVPMDANHDRDSAIVVNAPNGAERVAITGIGFENCHTGLYLYEVESASVDSSRFEGNAESIRSSRLGVLAVNSCEFASLTGAKPSGYHVIAHGPGEATIVGSSFTISSIHSFAWLHIQLQAISHGYVHDCTMTGGNIGIYATVGAGTVDISRCRIVDQFNAGIVHTMPHGTVRVSDTVMRQQYKALVASDYYPIWEVDRLVVEDAVEYSFGYLYLGSGHIRDSQLARGSRYVVKGFGGTEAAEAVTFDMTDNWWGTANADSVQAWIYDGNDPPSLPYYFIDWEPFRSTPVATKKSSLGGVKALFR